MTHMVEMSEGTTGSVSWKKTLVKIFIVLVFPIGIWTNYDYGLDQWTSILFHFEPSGLYFTSLFTVLLAIVLMLPGIFFERKIQLNPISSSIRRKAFISIVAILLLSYGFAFISIFNPYFIGIEVGAVSVFMPILTISLFIFLPILNRGSIIRSTPMNMQSHSFSYLSSIFKKRFRKLRFLPLLLWAGLLFSPIIISNPWGNISFLSIFFQIQVAIDTYLIPEFQFFYWFSLNLTPIYSLPYVMLIFSLRFVFVRDIYRFNEGRVQKSRLISTGLLAEIVPVAMLTLLNFPMMAYYQFVFPTPFFPLLGYLYVRFSKVPSMIDKLWEDEDYRMWYEGDKPAPLPVQKPLEHRIKVPLSYLIISQFRKRRK